MLINPLIMKKILLVVLAFLLLHSTSSKAQNGAKVAITSSKAIIAEKEIVDITATLDAATDKEVTINFDLSGTAKYDADYKYNVLPVISTVAGSNGRGGLDNQLSGNRGVFVDTNGNLYIADMDNGRIQKWVPGATAGLTVINGLVGPIDVYVDANNTIFVLEHYGNRVRKFVEGESFGGTIVAGDSTSGPGSKQLDSPEGFFVDDASNIYIADTRNFRIQKWTPGAVEGITVAGGNGPNNTNSISLPSAVYVD
jgi:hypothetical protein